MLQIGEQFVYGVHGVCRIIDVEIRRIDRKDVEYLVLAPIDQPGARFYVPAHNETALSKLRPLLTREELEALFEQEASHENSWICEENRRKQKYRELISNAERSALISMIRALHHHREAQLAAGRKFHLSDENFLRDAQKILAAEYSLVFGITKQEAVAYIDERIQNT